MVNLEFHGTAQEVMEELKVFAGVPIADTQPVKQAEVKEAVKEALKPVEAKVQAVIKAEETPTAKEPEEAPAAKEPEEAPTAKEPEEAPAVDDQPELVSTEAPKKRRHRATKAEMAARQAAKEAVTKNAEADIKTAETDSKPGETDSKPETPAPAEAVKPSAPAVDDSAPLTKEEKAGLRTMIMNFSKKDPDAINKLQSFLKIKGVDRVTNLPRKDLPEFKAMVNI